MSEYIISNLIESTSAIDSKDAMLTMGIIKLLTSKGYTVEMMFTGDLVRICVGRNSPCGENINFTSVDRSIHQSIREILNNLIELDPTLLESL